MEEKVKSHGHKSHKKNLINYASVLFIVGVLISFTMGFLTVSKLVEQIVIGLLVIFGFVIGFINIKRSEAIGFLVATLSLVLLLGPFLGMLSQNYFQPIIITKMFTYFVALVVPASLVVSLKEIFIIAEKE